MSDERRRILDMLAADRITVDQAEALLRALGTQSAAEEQASGAAKDAAAGQAVQPARSLQIQVQGNGPRGEGAANITIPLGLARFAGRFLPEAVRDEFDDQDVDIEDVLKALADGGALPAGSVLVDISSDQGKSIIVKAV